MPKMTLNTIILIIVALISLILLISTITEILGFLFIVWIWLPGFVFISFLIKSNRVSKIISEKSLKYISYFVFIFTTMLFINFLIRNYFPYSIGFLADYHGNLYEFLEQYRFSHPSISYFRPFIEIIELFFAADILFISAGAGILTGVCLKIFALENKK